MQGDLFSSQILEEPFLCVRIHWLSRRQVHPPCLCQAYVGPPSRPVGASYCPRPYLGVRMLSTCEGVEETKY